MELCPVCGALVPLHALEAHVNRHFDVPPPRGAGRAPDAPTARCTLCGIFIPLAQLDAHERAHSSGTREPMGASSAIATAAYNPAAEALPSLSTSSDVIIVSAPSSPVHKDAAGGSTSGAAPRAPIATAVASPAAAPATAAVGSTAALPSIICPYGCGQWIPVSQLDSHELAHQMAGPPPQSRQGRQPPPAAAVAAAAAAGAVAESSGPPGVPLGIPAAAVGEDDWMAAGLDDMDYSYAHDDAAADDAVAAAVAEEQAAARLQEEQDFEALRAKYGFSNKRPGRCFACGAEGHWSSECPQRGRAPPPPAARLSVEPSALAQQQRPDAQMRRGSLPRLVHALKTCLEGRPAHGSLSSGYQVFLCCPLQHFCATGSDRGWGCGWRNIQMLSSALLLRHPELRAALYAGAGFVPDIGSLQAWLEMSWAAGFDPLGCESLGGRIQGDRKWIGTTEAAALLRYFGVRAQVVDFEGAGGGGGFAHAGPPGSLLLCPDGATLHGRVECDLCGACPIRGVRHRSLATPNFDLCGACHGSGRPEVAAAAPYEATGTAAAGGGQPQAQVLGTGQRRGGPPQPHPQQQQQQQQQQQSHIHQPLVDWVWRYFAGKHGPTKHMWAPPPGLTPSAPPQVPPAVLAATAGGGGGSESVGGCNGGGGAIAPAAMPSPPPPLQLQLRSSPVTVTGMPPLYFQHEGHSRTIIGIERRREHSGAEVVTLLVLDPGAPAAALDAALAARRGWQRFVRRGQHTLTRPQYQLMYVDVPMAATAAGGSVLASPVEREAMKIIAAAEKHRSPAA